MDSKDRDYWDVLLEKTQDEDWASLLPTLERAVARVRALHEATSNEALQQMIEIIGLCVVGTIKSQCESIACAASMKTVGREIDAQQQLLEEIRAAQEKIRLAQKRLTEGGKANN